MYKILIADDEPIVLKTMDMLIKKNFPDVDEVFTAESGSEAIMLFDDYKPDVVIMDIMMPGLNGIESIKEIKKRYPETVCFVISAYDKFTYAKEVLEVGVIDYLLKPVSKDGVLKMVQKGLDIVSKRKIRQRNDIESKQKLRMSLSYLQSYALFLATFSDEINFNIDNIENLIDISFNRGCVVYVSMNEMKDHRMSIEETDLMLNKSDEIRFYFESKFNCLVSTLMLNSVIIYIPTNDENEKILLFKINDACTILTNKSDEEENKITIGIGRIYSGYKNIVNSYKEAKEALLYGKERVNFYNDLALTQEELLYPYSLEERLLSDLRMGEKERADKSFKKLFEWYEVTYSHSFLRLKSSLVRLMVVMLSTLNTSSEYEKESYNMQNDIINELLLNTELIELKTWFGKQIRNICFAINDQREVKISGIINDAKNYIIENYNTEISLSEISKKFSFSSTYFCMLFHKKMGIGFSDYITKLRIDKAKDMLVKSESSIKEISFEIGYSNPNYFSRMFKKATDVSPTEYRAKYHK